MPSKNGTTALIPFEIHADFVKLSEEYPITIQQLYTLVLTDALGDTSVMRQTRLREVVRSHYQRLAAAVKV